MARPKKSFPAYQLHKPSGQARVRVTGSDGVRRQINLGVYGSAASKAEYARLVAGMANGQAAAGKAVPTVDRTINEVLLAFLNHAVVHYRRADGSETGEVVEYKFALRPVRELYGDTPAAAFGPIALQAVRRKMLDKGWCRTRINKQVGRVRRVFKWAASQELVPVSVHQALATLTGLQRGRTTARETEPIGPADPAAVEAVLPFLTPTLRAMIELQRYTGMRPGEARYLQPCDIDRTGPRWIYRPSAHKTAYLGRVRVIPIGPRAQAVLERFLVGDCPPPGGLEHLDVSNGTARLAMAKAYLEVGRDEDARLLRDLDKPITIMAGRVLEPETYLFSPERSRDERSKGARRAKRKTKVQPSQRHRRKPAAELKKKMGRVFTISGYAAVIKRACKKAGVEPWHPNQLRHLYATEVRERYGLEAAQVALGHAKADVTQVYAERNHALADKVAAEMG